MHPIAQLIHDSLDQLDADLTTQSTHQPEPCQVAALASLHLRKLTTRIEILLVGKPLLANPLFPRPHYPPPPPSLN